jgi:[ribosomal protein S5]-alanine N-acetyltransferase
MQDAQALFEITNDAEVMRYYGLAGSFYSNLEEAADEIRWFQGLEAQGGGRWVIADSDNRYIGDIGFFDYNAENKTVELGYKLVSSHWNRGLTSFFMRQVLAWGFANRDYNRVYAYVEPENIASKAVLTRNAFVREGLLRDVERGRAGFIDLEVYSLLRREYLAA